MTPFIANTEDDKKIMLEAVGAASAAELFADVPEKFRFPELDLPRPLSEPEILAEIRRLAAANTGAGGPAIFAGAGAYQHFVPAVVEALASRGEFLTSYTPYQPEASQGTLQALFEYQSMTAELLGMDAINASHYDGATALAEAVMLAWRAAEDKRNKVLLSGGLHPEYREVVETYAANLGLELVSPPGGAWKPEDLEGLIDEETAGVVVSFPTFFGDLADYSGLCDAAHRKGALFIVSADPLSLALFAPPGSYGADIVTGEGQSLGNPLSFGGPYLGLFATTKKLLRRMPGRLVGMTTDSQGTLGFVLTLSTREQHIRREKATSNICTNQGLVALRAAIYLSVMGKAGLRRAAEISYRRARYAAEKLSALRGFEVLNQGSFFREFVLRCPGDAAGIVEAAAARGTIPGVALSRYFHFPDRTRDLLVCVTEMNSRQEIDGLVELMKTIGEEG